MKGLMQIDLTENFEKHGILIIAKGNVPYGTVKNIRLLLRQLRGLTKLRPCEKKPAPGDICLVKYIAKKAVPLLMDAKLTNPGLRYSVTV